MNEDGMKEVYFDQYCSTCKYADESEVEPSPCAECLENTVNLYSHKPVMWKEKETK